MMQIGQNVVQADGLVMSQKEVDVSLELGDIFIPVKVLDMWCRLVAYHVVIRKENRAATNGMPRRRWNERSNNGQELVFQ